MAGEHALGMAHHAGRGGRLVETAVLPAVAGHGLVRIDDDVADLAAQARAAVDHAAVEHDATAHAGAQRDEHEVAGALTAALPVFAHGGHVRVVAREDRHALKLRGQIARGVEAAPAEVHAPLHGAVPAHRPRHAHADGDDVLRLARVADDFPGDVRHDVAAVLADIRGNLPLVKQPAVLGERAELGGRAADIDAEKELVHAVFLSCYEAQPPACGCAFVY